MADQHHGHFARFLVHLRHQPQVIAFAATEIQAGDELTDGSGLVAP
jgi:hypothetical protein